jgi:CheY-like chemotaxis protein
MRLLFVEDDDDKCGKVVQEVAGIATDIEFVRARSFDSALRKLVFQGGQIDAVLLDMSMPNYDNSLEPPENFAGRDLLRQAKLRGISKPTVVITALDSFGTPPDQLSREQLDVELAKEFSPSYRGLVYYSSAHDVWRQELRRLLHQLRQGGGDHEDFDS